MPAAAKGGRRRALARAGCLALSVLAPVAVAAPAAAAMCKPSRLIGAWQHIEGRDGDMAIRYHHVWTFAPDGSMRCNGATCAIYPLGAPQSWRLERNRSLRIVFDSGESPLDICRIEGDGGVLRWRDSTFRKEQP